VRDEDYERQQVDVVDYVEGGDEASADEATLAVLQQDPAWAWLRAPEEDVHTGADAQSTPGS